MNMKLCLGLLTMVFMIMTRCKEIKFKRLYTFAFMQIQCSALMIIAT